MSAENSTELLDATAVAKLLVEIGHRMELAGESPFKARAYYRAADNLLAVSAPLPELIAKGKLRNIPGVGEAIAEKIIRLHKTGSHPTLDYMREQIPAGVLELLRIPGLGPKKASVLYHELKITNLQELEDACKSGKLDCKGLGAKLAAKILQGLEFMRKTEGQRLIHQADKHLAIAREHLQATHPELKHITAAGHFRLGREIVSDFCLVAVGSAEIPKESDVRVRLSDAEHYGLALLFETGSAEHLEKLQGHAKSKGFKLSETMLAKGAKAVPCPTEEDVYRALGLSYIEPELREGRDEIEWALDGKLPKLVADADLRGILHSHTDFSDGAQSLAAMADAVRERGYQYYGVADHSQSAGYAGGLKEDRVDAQHKLADELNAGYGGKFQIFKGIESDILEDGALDYPDRVLQKFDFIVASIHSRFGLGKEEQTRRLLQAVANPYTTILGHLTGRLLLQRDGYEIDMEAVLKACAKYGVVVEINAHPVRLDLDWRWHQRALELGCMLSINPDAHSINEIDLVKWGVVCARKGGVPRERVMNCMDLSTIRDFFARRKKH